MEKGRRAMDGGVNGDNRPRTMSNGSFGEPWGAGNGEIGRSGGRSIGATIAAGQNRRVGSLLR